MAVYQDFKNENDRKNNKPIKTKYGRSWYFKVYKNGKQYKSKKYLRRKDAENEEALFILKRDLPYNKPFELVADDYFNYLDKRKKESTLFTYKRDYNNHIKPFFEKMNISSIGVQNIREWAEKLEKKGLSVKYMNKIHIVLNNIFNFAIKFYGLEVNPSKAFGTFEEKNDKVIKDSEKIKYITLDQFNQLISIIEEPLWKTFFIFAYYTGCRKGEIQALTWKDISFEKNEISINKTLSVKSTSDYKITSTKNALNRKIKMSRTLKETLLNYKKEVIKYSDFKESWFVFGNSRFLPQTTIDNNKHKYFKLSGLKEEEITMHEFRHSHVSLLINEYIKSGQTDTAKFFLMVANRMGHSIQVMQDIYLHLFPTIQDEIVDILDNL